MTPARPARPPSRIATARSIEMGCCCSLPVVELSAKAEALCSSGGGRDAGEKFTVVRVASEADPLFHRVVDVLSRSFCGTTAKAPEPLNAWSYTGRVELGPLDSAPSEQRVAWFKWVMAYCAHCCLNVGGVYALVAKEGGAVVAATTVVPPGARGFGDMGMREVMVIMGKLGDAGLGGISGPAKDPAEDGKWQARDGILQKTMKATHASLAPDRHLYILCFGTEPERQGSGAGSTLMSFLNDLADADSVPSYLETGSEQGEAFFGAEPASFCFLLANVHTPLYALVGGSPTERLWEVDLD